MTQYNARNSILGVHGWIQLSSKLQLINFGLIQFSAIPGMKPPSGIHFVATKGSREQFPGKRAIP